MNVETSARLRFEPMTVSDEDAELMFQLDQDPEVMRYITGGQMTTREEIQETYIPRLKSYRNPQSGWGMWKVTLLEDDEFIGWILIRPMNFFNENRDDTDLEIGWRFKRAAWGKGYATEAARAVADALIANEQCQAITALALEDNSASINIMEKLGMKFVKKDLYVDPIGEVECVYYRMPVN